MELWRERALVFIIYLIKKILIIDWSKLYHVTRRKSIYHCLEGFGVLSFDLRSNDSTPKPSDRTSNPSATRLLHTHIIVASQWLQCRAALCALVLLCHAVRLARLFELAQNFNAIHCDVTMTLNIGITILPDLN